ncbi:MAG: sulfatase-like hydrolase/transferase, partial [Gemmataceae bacterium]|nr:sulfatase-like hydrolase/transferase [Gemmataceae bacterium]
LTGRYPRSLGVTQLNTALPAGTETLATILSRAGYRTAAIGKMHFNSSLSHGFSVRLDKPDHARWLAKKGKTPLPEGVAVLPPWRPFKDHARVWLNSTALPLGLVDADMPATWFVQQAAQFMTDHRREPFFLVVSFTEPHSPFHFPVEFRGRHRPEEFTVPKVGRDDVDFIPAIFRDLTDREKQGIAAAYATSVEYLDHNIGRMLDALEKLGAADHTLVIYLSDHGYCLGHHGRFEKHSMWEEAVRSPLLCRWPGRIAPQQSSAALVSLFDIVPTILEAVGQPIPKSMQAKSLVAVLTGRTHQHRDAVFIEYSENEEAMVRTDRWAFMYCSGKRQRDDGYATGKPLPGRTLKLFDMNNDPGQFENLAHRAEHADVVRFLTVRLVEHLRETARQPELLPRTDDVFELLDFLVQPRDVKTSKP